MVHFNPHTARIQIFMEFMCVWNLEEMGLKVVNVSQLCLHQFLFDKRLQLDKFHLTLSFARNSSKPIDPVPSVSKAANISFAS